MQEKEQANDELETTATDEAEGSEDQATEVTPESEAVENEVVLAQESDAQPEPKVSKAEHIKRRISRREKYEKLEDQNTDLQKKLEALSQAQPAAIEAEPDDLDFDNRKDYLQAKAKHSQGQVTSAIRSELAQQQTGHNIAAASQKREKNLTDYAESAAKMNVTDYNGIQEKALEVLGDQFADAIIQSVPGDDASKLMFYFGKNPAEAAIWRDKYQSDPMSGSITFSLGKLAEGLKLKPKVSQAADPESKVIAGAGGGSNGNWQKQLDKIDEATTDSTIAKSLRARREVKRQAKAAGFDLSALN